MKTVTLTFKGADRYASHPTLLAVAKRVSGWDEEKSRDFLKANAVVRFNQLPLDSAKGILEELKRGGFELSLTEAKNEIRVSLNLSYEKELCEIKRQVEKIKERISLLETLKGVSPVEVSVQDPVMTEKLSGEKAAGAPGISEHFVSRMRQEIGARKEGAEADIGKYWLSRIGVFTLLLGVVFFITYTIQFLGAWGKLGTGFSVGTAFVVFGNFLSKKENYRRWAMSIIGGGWAILYFTMFAAYHVPIVKVIHHPWSGLFGLLVTAVGFIAQSLRYRSRVLVFMAYFLAFLAMTTTGLSFYTLIASYFLAISMVFVTKKLGWSWLACLGLLMVYTTHWVWLGPAISAGGLSPLETSARHFTGFERFSDMLFLPWIGHEWRIYPLVDFKKSVLHLSFLILYWLLFTSMGFFRDGTTRGGRRAVPVLLTANGLIFTASFMHHLHVYYPGAKYLFALAMTLIFFTLSKIEMKKGWPFLSDIYLGFAASLLCLAVPMYFDGSSVTYGWSMASAVLVWLGLRYERIVLRWIAAVVAGFVLIRLVCFDYLEQKTLFRLLLPVHPFMLTALISGASFLSVYFLYGRFSKTPEKERRMASNTALILSAWVLGMAFLLGGFRQAASCTGLLGGCILMAAGFLKKRVSVRISAAVLIGFSGLRLIAVDFAIPMTDVFIYNSVLVRYAAGVLSLGFFMAFTEWLRRQIKHEQSEKWPFPCLAALAVFIFLALVSDNAMAAVLSLLWGIAAFGYILCGFRVREKIYRRIGLALFGLVLGRLFLHDFAQLETIYRIVSFMAIGGVFIVAGFIYNYYSKLLLADPGEGEGVSKS